MTSNFENSVPSALIVCNSKGNRDLVGPCGNLVMSSTWCHCSRNCVLHILIHVSDTSALAPLCLLHT